MLSCNTVYVCDLCVCVCVCDLCVCALSSTSFRSLYSCRESWQSRVSRSEMSSRTLIKSASRSLAAFASLYASTSCVRSQGTPSLRHRLKRAPTISAFFLAMIASYDKDTVSVPCCTLLFPISSFLSRKRAYFYCFNARFRMALGEELSLLS